MRNIQRRCPADLLALARQQGKSAVTRFEDLLGQWPVGENDFDVDAFLAAREERAEDRAGKEGRLNRTLLVLKMVALTLEGGNGLVGLIKITCQFGARANPPVQPEEVAALLDRTLAEIAEMTRRDEQAGVAE